MDGSSRKEKKIRQIKREAEMLKNCPDPIVIIGRNDLSIRMEKLICEYPSYWGMISLSGDNNDEYQAIERTMADLMELRGKNAKIYCMSRFRDKEIEGELSDMGFAPCQLQRLGYGTENRVRGCKLLNAYDPLLNATRVENNEYPGFTIFSNCNDVQDIGVKLTILTLGGSTSDPTFVNIKSWSEILFHLFVQMGKKVIIYAGGIGGYTSAQEMKKLLRDGLILKPDIVISYSGVNDAVGRYMENKYPFFLKEERIIAEQLIEKKMAVNSLQKKYPLEKLSLGISDERSAFELWFEHERVMHGVCTEFNIKFLGILQPAKQEYMNHNAFYREADSMIKTFEYPWLMDARSIFEEDNQVFYDFCHVYERGNRKIARYVLAELLRIEKEKIE